MGIIDTLAVSMTARTQKFTSGLQRASRDLSRFTRRTARTAARIGAFGLALTGVAAAGGLGAFVTSSFKAINSTAKFAQRLGVATEELTALRFAGKQAGIAQQALDTGLQRVIRRGQEVAMGMGEARFAFKQLGLDAQAFVALPLEQKILTLSDRFSRLKSGGEAVLDAFKLFDTEGVGFVTLLKQGPAQIRRLLQEARRLGVTFNDVDAAKVEAASDAIGRMQAKFQGLGQTLAIQLAPFVEAFADSLTQLSLNGEGLGTRLVDAFEGGLSMIAKLINGTNLLAASWHTFRGVVETVVGHAVAGLGILADKIAEFLDFLPGVNAAAPNFAKDFGFRLIDASKKSFEQAQQAREKFVSADLETGITQFFDQVRSRADAAAKKAVDGRIPQASLPSAVSGRNADPFAARSIDVSREFIGALNSTRTKEQRVSDPALLESMNELVRLTRQSGDSGALAS